MASDRFERLLRLGAALGTVVLPLWWVFGGAGGGMLAEVSLGIAGGVAVVVPLGLLATRQTDRDGLDPGAWRWAVLAWPLSAPMALLGLLGEPSPLSAGLVLPWLALTVCAGLFGLRRLGRRAHLDLAELCLDVALLYLPVGGIWLLASRAGVPLLGFAEPWASLTAAHFHFAGFGLPILAGLVGRALPTLADDTTGEEPRGVASAWTVPAWASILGPPLTAAGISLSPVLELFGSLVMLVAAVGTGGFLLVLALSSSLPRSVRRMLGVAGAVPVWTSALALLWALSQVLDSEAFPALPFMVRYHGIINAVGFVALGFVGFARVRIAARVAPPGVPFSRLRGGIHVGRWFFRREGLIPQDEPAPVGLVDNLDVFGREGVEGLHDLRPSAVHPVVRRFYEHTGEFELAVAPQWFFPASLVAPLVRALSRMVGQLELPTDPLSDRGMDGELVPLRDGPDGRTDVRGWVRLHAGTERPVFLSAYAHHRYGGVPYMNIAMPLPGSNLASILRVDPGTLGGLVLTTRRMRGFVGDEGVYLVTRWGELRLPMHETLIIGPASGRAGEVAATHEVHVTGLRALRLTYHIRPKAITEP